MSRTVRDEQFDAVVSEMFGPDPGDLDQLPDEDDDVEAFGRRGRGGGRGRGRGRGRGHFRPGRWGGTRWHHRGPWFVPYWTWGSPLYRPAVDPDGIAEEVTNSMFDRDSRGDG